MLPATQAEIVRIIEYMLSQAPDLKVQFVQKVYSENVLHVRHDIWDVHTDVDRWWVITEPMNLYAQEQFPAASVRSCRSCRWKPSPNAFAISRKRLALPVLGRDGTLFDEEAMWRCRRTPTPHREPSPKRWQRSQQRRMTRRLHRHDAPNRQLTRFLQNGALD
jgi:hypothetical protein